MTRRAILANVLFVLAVFPYFSIVPGLKAEVQPIGAVVGLIACVLMWRCDAVVRALTPLLAVICAAWMLFIVEVVLGSVTAETGAALEGLAILLAPLALAAGFSLVADSLSPRTLMACAASWAGLGILQLFGQGLLQSTGVAAALAAAIPRLAVVAQGENERGASMFAPEPSYAAPSILLMLAASLWLHSRGRLGGWRLGLVLGLVGLMILLNASASLLIMSLLFGLMLTIGAARRHPVLVAPAAALLVLSLWGLASFQESGIRPLRVAGQMSALVTTGSATVSNLVEVSELNDSARLGSIIQGYAGTSARAGLGLGLGSWSRWISPFSADTIFVGARPKPFAYGAFVAMALGVPGLLALGWALARLVLDSLRQASTGLALACAGTALLGILVNSPASLPAYWVMLALPVSGVSRRRPP